MNWSGGNLFPPIFGLKLPVVKARVPKQNHPREWRVGLKILGERFGRQSNDGELAFRWCLIKKTMSAHKIRSACQPFLIIVRGRTLVLRANAKKVFLTNCPPRWLALYGYLRTTSLNQSIWALNSHVSKTLAC